MTRLRYVLPAVLLFVVVARDAAAQISPPSPDPAAGKRITAVAMAGAAPHVDGRLDDAVWSAVPFRTDFLQKEPVLGGAPSAPTEVAFMYDADALYVAARMHCSKPEELHSMLTRRDNSGSAERFIVTLDTYHDRRTAYSFSVTAAGVRTDYYHAEDNEFSREFSFDPVWEARVAIDSAGWTAEMRIPFSQLRFNEHEEQVWGLNMDRYVPSNNEDIYWIPIPKEVAGWASRFGELTGIRGIRPTMRLEVMPYASLSATLAPKRTPGDPTAQESEVHAHAGLDLKMGLGSNLTLDATVNPDFGQVEADPAQVNLSAYETIFDERRPFFVEGISLLTGPGGYFYSRRIGAPPHGAPANAVAPPPPNTTILGAGKVTGRLASGTSLGGLVAVTQREFVDVSDSSTEIHAQQIEPVTAYAVARVGHELSDDGSEIGGMVTAVRRDLEAGTPLDDRLVRTAISGGGDWVFRFDKGTYELNGHLGGSYISGSSRAIARVQRSSAHYFQRPDAEFVRFDSTRTSLAGLTGGLAMVKRDGDHWLWTISGWVETPGLELNDIGRLSSASDINFENQLIYRETTPTALFHDYSATLSLSSPFNFEWESSGSVLALNFNATLPNFWGVQASADYGTTGIADDMTRGGPLMAVPWNWDGSVSVNSPYGARTMGSAGLNFGGNGEQQWYYNAWASISTIIGDRLELRFEPTYSRSNTTRQFIAAYNDGPAATYGARYVFGRVYQTSINATVRARYSLSPDMSLELYAEPFAASGRYDSFGELVAARRSDLRMYGTDGTSITPVPDEGYAVTDGASRFNIPFPDYYFVSFRSNLVMRWEWLPGSTMYLVWQQDRSLYDSSGRPVAPDDLFQSITALGTNFFTLKFSYWIPVG